VRWLGPEVVGIAPVIWVGVLLLPWAPWRVRERLTSDPAQLPPDLSDTTALVPARDEATTIATALRALVQQGRGLRVIVVDDRSTDGTAAVAREVKASGVEVVDGRPLPLGWTGKLWALEQGRGHVTTPWTLLMDADVVLAPGTLGALRARLDREGARLGSLMVELAMEGFWERLLLPPFVYFFRLLYPFHLANSPTSRVAAAAGGCILVETRVLEEIGGFHALRDALIDDCTLARRVKDRGHRTWIGLTRAARSLRRYHDLATIWDMVARTAYTQLRYSPLLLLLCTMTLGGAFWLPVVGLFAPLAMTRWLAGTALVAMAVSYAPILRYYGVPGRWAVTLPVAATLFLAMTWASAGRYWRGTRSRWKGRAYSRQGSG
jgi:hopene-associated glycosyltransferase HpnB